MLKSIDFTNCMNSMISCRVSLSYGVGQVSPVRVMAFCRVLLSFSSCGQLKIMCLIVCSAGSLQGQVELGLILSLCRYALFKPLKPELNSICYLLALLGAHHFLHVSRIRVKLLTFKLLMSYIYGAPILDVSRSHTTTQHSR